MKTAALIFFFTIIAVSSRAQDTRGTLGVTHFERITTLNKLFKALNHSSADTEKVNLFNKISALYWRMERPSDIDSSIYYAGKALELSISLHYVQGSNEALFLKCKGFTKKGDIDSAKTLLPLVHGEMRVRLLLVIAEYYVFLPEQKIQNLHKARPFMAQARRLCDSLHSSFWRRYYLLLYAKYYFEKGEYEKGRAEMLEIINDYKKRGDLAGQAQYWNELGIYLPDADSTYRDKVHSLEMAQTIYMQINRGEDASYALRDLASANLSYGHLDSAEKQITRFINLQRQLGIKFTFNSHIAAAQIFAFNGNLVKGLSFLLPALKMNPELKDLIYAHQLIADIYYALGSHEKSLYYNRLALRYCLETNRLSAYAFCHRIVLNQIALKQTGNTLLFLKDFERKYPPAYVEGKEYLALCYGDAYNSLGEYGNAEQQYLTMIRNDQQLESKLNRRLEGIVDDIHINSVDAYLAIGDFYVNRKQFADAAPYLIHARKIQPSEELKNNNIQIPIIARQMKLEFGLYKIDSAAGRYVNAIRHLNQYHHSRDSVFRITKSTPFEELQLQYKAIEREQSIKLLKDQSQRKDRELKALNQQRNITIAGIIILAVIALLAYFAYKGKQRINKQLEFKQKEINVRNEEISQKNILQEQLLAEKEQLIQEKELLVKEVNHRVKNNLQIMISLLSKQSSFLTDEALSAVLDSKNRMQAIATLHQKFYDNANIGSVNMKEYVLDFVRYLSYSLNTGKNLIHIRQNIEIDALNIAQAAPLGLILNEAVTNSIKHAFTGRKNGTVQIDLLRAGDSICLSIADNGKGLPSDIELIKGKSMGMELMTALSKQLGGTLKLKNEEGLKITVLFKENTRPVQPVTASVED